MNTLYSWDEFLNNRESYLSELGPTIQAAVARRDTTHPAFCGCYDWHSAVHGAYALLALYRLTGEERYWQSAREVLEPAKLERELQDVKQQRIPQEVPYGYAWFLCLAREYELTIGGLLLADLAEEIARQLEQYLFSLSPADVAESARCPEYQNVSWPVLCFWQWAMGQNDHRRTEALADFCRTHLLGLDAGGLLELDWSTDGFYPPALKSMRTVATVLNDELPEDWFAAVLDRLDRFSPLAKPATAHAAGLNFSRSWAFWTLYERTGDLRFRQQYVDHLCSHMARPEYWRDDYGQHGHWVPQFGVYAIACSCDSQPKSTSSES